MRGSFDGGEPACSAGALCSTGSTRPGRSSTRRPPTASPRQARRSSPSRTAPRSGCSWTRSQSPATTTEVREYTRALDMQRAVLGRTVVFRLSNGQQLRVHSERLVSLAQRHLACIRYEVTAVGMPAHVMVSLRAHHAGGRRRRTGARPPAGPPAGTRRPSCPTSSRSDGVRVTRTFRARGSGLAVAAGMDHDLDVGAAHISTDLDPARARVVFELDAARGGDGRVHQVARLPPRRHGRRRGARRPDGTDPRSCQDLGARDRESRSTSSRWRTSGSAARLCGTAAAQRSRPFTSTCSRCSRRP